MSEAVLLDPGVAWSLTLDATDPDDDLATVDVEFTGSSSDWIEFEQSTLTIKTADDMSG